MKQDQIKFRNSYNDLPEFTPYRDYLENWIYQRDVVIEPMLWNQGSMIQFKIVDYYRSHEHGTIEKVLVSITYYDKDNPDHKELISNLASGDLRGKLAESTADKLFYDLFLFSKWMKHYLPKVVEYWTEMADKYNFKTNCGIVGFGQDPIL